MTVEGAATRPLGTAQTTEPLGGHERPAPPRLAASAGCVAPSGVGLGGVGLVASGWVASRLAPLRTPALRPAGVDSRPGGGVSGQAWHVAVLSRPGTAENAATVSLAEQERTRGGSVVE